MRKVLLALGVAGAVLGAYTLFVPRAGGEDSLGPISMRSPLPTLKGEAVSGGTIDLADFRGQVTVVNVWATWCPPCRSEQPDLVRTAQRYADRGVQFVGLNFNDNIAAARVWIDEFDVPYDSLFDEEGRSALDLGYPYLPDTYVVDRKGTIRWAIYGATNQAELSTLIDQVLRGHGRSEPGR